MRNGLRWVLIGLLIWVAAAKAGEKVVPQEWPQWMGPSRNCVIEGVPLPAAWPATGPKQLWSLKCGAGQSGPVLADGILVLMERNKDKATGNAAEEVTRGIDIVSGKEIWRATNPCAWKAARGYTWGPCSTPAIAQGRVVCLGVEGRLRCLELATGKVVWEKELQAEFKMPSDGWGVVTSPLLVDDLVIVQICSPEPKAGVVAWALKDGKEAWRTPTFPNYGVISPGLIKSGDAAVVLAGASAAAPDLNKGDLFGLDAKSGKLLWSVATGKSYYNCPTPIAGDGLVFIEGGGGDGPTVAVKLTDGATPVASIAWQDPKHLARFSNYLYYKGLLFGHGYPAHGGRHLFFCLDPKDGSLLWEQDEKGEHQSFVASDGKILQLHETGELVLLDADARKGRKELARAKVIDKTWSQPALANGRLYVRSDTELKCLDLLAK